MKRCCLSPQAKHASEGCASWGVDGDKGVLVDMKELGVWDPLSVKIQTYKTAIEVCDDAVLILSPGFIHLNFQCLFFS